MMRMVFTVFILFFACFQAVASHAEDLNVEDLNVTSYPVCFTVRNSADYTVYGSVSTDYYPDPTVGKSRHRSDFRLSPAGSVGDDSRKLDRAEFCSYGPFYEEFKLDLVLRTLFPIFSCKTRVDQGEIVIISAAQDDGSTKTRAICFP